MRFTFLGTVNVGMITFYRVHWWMNELPEDDATRGVPKLCMPSSTSTPKNGWIHFGKNITGFGLDIAREHSVPLNGQSDLFNVTINWSNKDQIMSVVKICPELVCQLFASLWTFTLNDDTLAYPGSCLSEINLAWRILFHGRYSQTVQDRRITYAQQFGRQFLRTKARSINIPMRWSGFTKLSDETPNHSMCRKQ